MLRDSRILSVVEKWSNEMIAGSGHSAEVVTEIAESADVGGDVEQEREGSGTETWYANGGSEVTDTAADKPPEAASRNDAEVHMSSVSNNKVRCFDLLVHFHVNYSCVFYRNYKLELVPRFRECQSSFCYRSNAFPHCSANCVVPLYLISYI